MTASNLMRNLQQPFHRESRKCKKQNMLHHKDGGGGRRGYSRLFEAIILFYHGIEENENEKEIV